MYEKSNKNNTSFREPLDRLSLDEQFDKVEEVTILELEEIADALEFILDLEPHICAVRGTDYPCIFCENKCDVGQPKEIKFMRGKGVKTINSSILSLNFEKRDTFEEYLITKLVRELSREKLNIITSEEGYDITFFFKHEDRWRKDEIIVFVLGLFEKVKRLMPEAKAVINTWIRNKVKAFEREETLKQMRK
nr:hypothetical protein [Candidatus Freyarchaeota archaeon]